jgi:hypothetical protein
MKWKSVITIYSDFDPQQVELSALAREAEDGGAICDSMKATVVPDTELPEGVQEFFDLGEELDFEASPDPGWMNP